jgi:Ni/Fe-hydrogenase subunit HybB-like protein
MTYTSALRPPLVLDNKNKADVSEDICKHLEGRPSSLWNVGFTISVLCLAYGGYCLGATWWNGVGMWGESKTINWAWDITNFVWWIGIGHAGTLISAILLLFRQHWRNSINRAAEAMTLCAVICSAIFIFAHLGRPWLAHWILPLPNAYGSLWVNFDSALVWDCFAIAVYLSVSLLYWYIGLIPDFATLRDRSTGLRSFIYGILCLDWKGSAWAWRRYESVQLILAGLATPLVLSVHSIVSMDFSTGIVPGWHSTIFPPYFVAGAILSGFAMVITLILVARLTMNLQSYITEDHLDSMNKIIILNSGILGIAYLSEAFIAWYSGSIYEQYQYYNRVFGHYGWAYILIVFFNVLLPQLLWIKKLRRNFIFSFVMALIINVGMWVERFVIIVTSLSRDFLPSSWALFMPTMYDIGVFIFSLGLFFFMFLLFGRYVPFVSMWEVKSLIKKREGFKR